MTHAGPDRDAGAPERDLRATGDRIELLLEASAAGGPLARERAEELVRLVVDLYGAGLERVLDILHESGRLDGDLLDLFVADDLVASLLLVHGLHPDDVGTRVAGALDSVRPYLGSHGGDVELIGLTPQGVVRLRMLGSCDGCPSSSVTLTLAVETAIHSAAPEVVGIEVEQASDRRTGMTGASAPVIPVSALRSRLARGPADPPATGGVDWHPVEGLEGLRSGQVAGFTVAGVSVVGARIGADLFVYRDRCARCGASLADGVVERVLGGRATDAVLRCPRCHAHYDVRRAGAGLDPDGTAGHLDPLPLLRHEGLLSIALPGAVSA